MFALINCQVCSLSHENRVHEWLLTRPRVYVDIVRSKQSKNQPVCGSVARFADLNSLHLPQIMGGGFKPSAADLGFLSGKADNFLQRI